MMQSECFDTKYHAKSGDIAICDYPRTGTTWLRAMLAHMFLGSEAAPKQLCDRIAWLESNGPKHMDTQPEPHMWSSHACVHMCPWSDASKYIVLVRNPKDNCVSFYYHAIKTGLCPESTTFNEFFEMYITGQIPDGYGGQYQSYFQYYLDWWNRKNKVNVKFVTYEDLKSELDKQLMDIADFVGHRRVETLTADDNRLLKGIIEATTFTKMKPEIDGFGYGFFARKGVVGDYKNYLTPDMEKRIDEVFHKTFEGTEFHLLWKDHSNF